MTSIDSLGFPLAYKARIDRWWPQALAGDGISLRTEVRALEGMQKEALVYYTPAQTVWRMVSDEGPYLNGTDLAPFPLAFFTAGMAFSFVAELLKQAEAENITLNHLKLTQDNYYTMEGSAIRGDMTGGVLPAELVIEGDTDASQTQIDMLVRAAANTSPAQAYMRDALQNIFSLSHNGDLMNVERVQPTYVPYTDPKPHFETVRLGDQHPRADIITKLEAARSLHNVEGGAGSSLKSDQKRTLHVRGEVTVQDDGLLQARVQLLKPIGSTFRFLCDHQQENSPKASTPSPLAYLAAGVGFCFMTQVGRYATIVKQDLKAYRIVQDTVFKMNARVATAEPVNTHLFIETSEPVKAAQKTLSMSEQTCFLHAAMRTICPSIITAKLVSSASQARTS